MSAPTTVLEAVQLFEREGYTASVVPLPDGTPRCGGCAGTHAIEHAVVDRVFRYEGVSDPDDEAIVLGLHCPRCGAKAILVSPFGPNADPAILRPLRMLQTRFPADG